MGEKNNEYIAGNNYQNLWNNGTEMHKLYKYKILWCSALCHGNRTQWNKGDKMTDMIKDKIQQATKKTRTCPHCNETLENVTPLQFGRHVQSCPKRKTVKTVLPKHTITVCNVDHPDPRTPMKAKRLQ